MDNWVSKRAQIKTLPLAKLYITFSSIIFIRFHKEKL